VLDGKRLTLGPGPTVLGRSRECDVTLADTNVSRRHAELRPQGERWLIADLGSTNGTRVNGRRIADPVALEDGDVVVLGETELRFERASR
jgi:pSer/pThr/pTyr-binding forkhead associated (FHA) protein